MKSVTKLPVVKMADATENPLLRHTHTHLSFFPEKLDAVSNEQRIKFHQDVAEMEHCNKEDRSWLCWEIGAGFSVGKLELPIKEGSNYNITWQLLSISFPYGI
jgi:hypothetical protein